MIKQLMELHHKEELKILGLMTGTSADGLDIAGVKFKGYDKYPEYEVFYSHYIPYPDEFSKAFKRPLELSASEIAKFDLKLGKWYAEVISKIEVEYDVIANHGQTLLHHPPFYTLQIGEAQCILEKCRKPVIYDFRTADVLLGGQGAPLIPIIDEFLLRESHTTVIALNMGGIANLTLLPPRGSDRHTLAWDTGPANTLIDKAVIDFTKGRETYDLDGKYARAGDIEPDLLEFMMQYEYFNKAFPKSAGQEQFGNEYYEQLKINTNPETDLNWLSFIRSITECTIKSITQDIHKLIEKENNPVKVVVSGGGANNMFIMERLKEELPNCKFEKFARPGINSEIKEAFGFAYLGYLFLRQLPGNIPFVTGASRQTVLGKIVF
ncbi:MAG: anhydro-N-acetylmuramic acid kinase [Candidatus Marinimicrobia bacterium]|nr:anhydro-N-acetylmuramic acid kinase [Candidatus Neomarinimicrobiota bacterium]